MRIDGCDIEPGAEQRTDFALSCRVFRTERGFSGEPDEQWVRDALLRERAVSSEISAARHLEASPRIAEALAADFLSKHLDVPEVDMEHIATALSERGYAVDSASGKLVHPPSNRPLRR